MNIFISNYENKVDKKGRVSVPSSFRSVLFAENSQDSFVFYKSFKHNCIVCMSNDQMKSITQKILLLDDFSDDKEFLSSAILGSAREASMDSEGRVLINKDILNEVGITDKVVFVGKGDKFEMWNPKDFEAHLKESKKMFKQNPSIVKLKNDK